MDIVLRRSAVVISKMDSEESLAERCAVGDVYGVLYRYGALDLADEMVAHLAPGEALAVAAGLRRMVRRQTRRGLLRDYRTVLSSAEAGRIGLVATWLERAGRAGCYTWADLRASVPVPGLF